MADKNESGATVSDELDDDEVVTTSQAGGAGETPEGGEGSVGTEQDPSAQDPSAEAEQAEIARKAGTLGGLLSGLVREARPKQWVKNVLVVAVPFLAHGIGDPNVMIATGFAFLVFCMAASGIYFVNDAKDVESDRAHPTKRFRPIAAGLVPLPVAYVVVQLGYCYGLKHQPVIDMCIVSSGFLLRVVAGGAAATLGISQWFMLVTAFGSLFMVAGKRYAEIIFANQTGAKIRKSLESYSASYLRFVWATSAAMVIVNYSLWAYQQHQIARVWSALSIVPFVIAILRYAVDVDRGGAGEPEEVVLKDKIMIVLGGLLAFCLFMLFYGDSVKSLIGLV